MVMEIKNASELRRFADYRLRIVMRPDDLARAGFDSLGKQSA